MKHNAIQTNQDQNEKLKGGIVFGYARVSSRDQNLSRQIEQLENYGCEKIIEEKRSGKNIDDREELQKLLEVIRVGDTIVVSDMTRIARSLSDLLKIIETIKEKEAYFVSLKENIDTKDSSIYTKFLTLIMGAVAEFEREMMKERQDEGVKIAKRKGKFKGGKEIYTDQHKGLQQAIKLYKQGESIVDISEITKISRPTLYRKFRKHNIL